MKDKKILNTSFDEPSFDMDDLKKRLIEENNFLTKLVDTIPAKMYLEFDIQEKLTAEKHSAMDMVAEEIKRISSNHIELSAKGKHKRSRLDPLNQKSVSQIHDELSKKKRKKKKNKGVLIPSASLTRAANVEELQKRLHERINFLQEKRKAARKDPEAKKKLKTKVKKLKVKQKGNLVKAAEISKNDKPPENNKKVASSDKPMFNKESNFIFSKFNFNENELDDPKRKKHTVNNKTKVLLKKAEKKKEQLESLKTTDPGKAQSVTEKEKWKKAIQKVEGAKIRDDPNLLKKTLKKEEKKKKKSSKMWKQRTEETEKRQKTRQEKRDRNIKDRKKEKFDRKLKLAKKKGRFISGF